MDELVLEKKIDSVIRCLRRIENRLPQEKMQFLKDLDAQDVVVLNLTRAIQLCVDIAMHVIATSDAITPQTMSESFTVLEKLGVIDREVSIKMKKSVGFRNIAIHSYDDLDLNLTFEIAYKHLNDFKDYIRQIVGQ